MNVHGLGEKTDTVHLGHALIGKQKGYRIIARLEFAERAEGSAAGIGAHHAVMLGVMPAQVALNGPQYFGIVIHGQHHWLWHRSSDEKKAALVTCAGPS